MKFTLNLTHKCNLRCTYCYAGRQNSSDMSEAIAEQSVAFACSITPLEETLEFSFFGGEPLLCPGLLRDATNAIATRQADRNQPIRMSITSNGTLIDSPAAEFLARNDIDLCISLDGPEFVHNLNRQYPGKRGSFQSVMKGLSLALRTLPRVQVNAVYSPETLEHMPETLRFFLSENIPVVHFNPNITACWSAADLEKIPQVYDKLADTYLATFRNNAPVAVSLIDSKMILFMKGGYAKEDQCGMGESEMAVAPSGNIYPCERFVGDDSQTDFVIGHVSLGFTHSKRCQVRENRGNCNTACLQCDISKYCMKWCGCTNYNMTGYTNRTGPMLCVSERAAVRAALRVFTTLARENNDTFFKHLMQYATKECHTQSAPGAGEQIVGYSSDFEQQCSPQPG